MLTYILILGILQLLAGIFEIFSPVKAFYLWKQWIENKFFILHGIILIAVGFPLTIYNNSLSDILFIIGLIYVLSGPFVIIYPEKIKSVFSSYYEETGNDGGKKVIIFDSLLRILIGCLCIASYFLSIIH